MNSIIRYCVTMLIVSGLLIACGNTPKKSVDKDGLRDRAERETDQVR